MLGAVRSFLNEEKFYAWLLIAVLLSYSFIIAFVAPQKNIPSESPAMQRVKAAQTQLKENKQEQQEVINKIMQEPYLALFIIGSMFVFVSIIFTGIVLGGIVIYKKKHGQAPFACVYKEREIPWNMHDVVKLIILFCAYSLAIGFSLSFIRDYFLPNADNFFIILNTVIADLVVLFLIIYFVRRKYNTSLHRIGLNENNVMRDVFLGLGSYCVILPCFMVVVMALSYLVSLVRYEPAPHPLVDIFVVEDKDNMWLIWFSVFLACTVGPFIEEVFFRGFCYTALRKAWGVKIAMVGSAAFFSLIHYSAFAFIPIFLLGLVLAYLYEKRGTLIPSITVHIIHNSLFIGYFFILKRVFLDNV